MIGKHFTARIWIFAAIGGVAACAAPTANAGELTTGQAKKVAVSAVASSDSFKQMKSPFELKVKSCKRNGKRTTCSLYRSVSQPCGLNGGPKTGQVCATTVAYRSWSVRVTSKSASILSTSDVVGRFAPTT